MVEGYSREIMAKKWNLSAKYDAWLKVELVAVKAWNKLGPINDEDYEKIQKNTKFDTARIDEIEKMTKHDVIALLTSVSESLGEESRLMHCAMTSSDCIGTAVALQMKESLEFILEDVEPLLEALKGRANEHKNTLMAGRGHGIHGEPIVFGFVAAIWYDEIRNAKELLSHAKETISYGKISDAMGNSAHAPLELEEETCKNLGLKPAPISSQTIQRDRYAQVLSASVILAANCEQIVVAMRYLQRTEVYEAGEYFSEGQKGSPAMSHKRNLVLSGDITGSCRVLRPFVTPALENVALRYERDISHSGVERFVLPDAFITTDFTLMRLTSLMEKLLIYPQNMMKDLNLTGGLVSSQRVPSELPFKGLSREEAYKTAQRNAMRIWKDLQEGKSVLNEKNEGLFLFALLDDEDLKARLGEEDICKCFDYAYYTKNIDSIFNRIFK